MIYLVSRHPGAIRWCQQQSFAIDSILSHLDPALIAEKDIVIGTLPINLAAEIQEKGARYIHLSLRVPYELRGVELTSEKLDEINASLQEYSIKPIN